MFGSTAARHCRTVLQLLIRSRPAGEKRGEIVFVSRVLLLIEVERVLRFLRLNLGRFYCRIVPACWQHFLQHSH